MKAESEVRTPEQVARAAFAAVQARDPGGIVAFGHPDRYIDEFVAIGTYTGKVEVRDFFQELFTAFPDSAIEVIRVVGGDDVACVQWHLTGTHSGGPFLGYAPSGRKVELQGVDVMEVEDGLIAHNTIYYDAATFARQIGLLPGQDSKPDLALKFVFNAWTRLRARVKRR